MLFVDADKNVEVDEISEIHGVKHNNESELIAKNNDRGYFDWEWFIIMSMQPTKRVEIRVCDICLCFGHYGSRGLLLNQILSL